MGEVDDSRSWFFLEAYLRRRFGSRSLAIVPSHPQHSKWQAMASQLESIPVFQSRLKSLELFGEMDKLKTIG